MGQHCDSDIFYFAVQLQHDKVCSELACVRREHDQAEEKINKLKELCGELDAQITDYEAINAKYEARDAKWKQEKWVNNALVEPSG